MVSLEFPGIPKHQRYIIRILATGTSTRVLRYLDRPLTKDDKPDARSRDNVFTRVTDFNDGGYYSLYSRILQH